MNPIEEYRKKLLECLMAESEIRFNTEGVPEEQSQMLQIRSYMNIRRPLPASEELLRIQDVYLSSRKFERGIVDHKRIPTIDIELGSGNPFSEKICLWQGDITRLDCDAIVNAANSQMLGCFQPCHACIDNCIHTYAGIQMRLECNSKMESLRGKFGQDYDQPTAAPMITDAYNLPCRKVIHVVGPIYGETPIPDKDLEACYRNVLDMCRDSGLRSVAFCCISTGVFRFPNRRAAEIAVSTVNGWLEENEDSMDRVIFNVFLDKDREIYEGIFS